MLKHATRSPYKEKRTSNVKTLLGKSRGGGIRALGPTGYYGAVADLPAGKPQIPTAGRSTTELLPGIT